MYATTLPIAPFIGAANYPFSHEYAIANKDLSLSEMHQKWLEEEAYTPEKRDGISIFDCPYTKYILIYKKDDIIRYVLFYKKIPDLKWEIHEEYKSTTKISSLKNSQFAQDCELHGECIGILKTKGVISATVLSHPMR